MYTIKQTEALVKSVVEKSFSVPLPDKLQIVYKKKMPVMAIKMPDYFECKTLENKGDSLLLGTPGDYLMIGALGEHWPLNAEAFARTYVPFDEQPTLTNEKRIEELKALLLTQDGKGVKAKQAALEELLKIYPR